MEIILTEITNKDLQVGVDARTKKYSKGQHPDLSGAYSTKYVGVTRSKSVVFETKSKHKKRRGIFYVQWIKLLDYADDPEFNTKENMQLALAGDIKVHCNCEAERYFYSYILSKVKARSYQEENRFPGIKNPQLKGTVCKHAYVVLKALPFNISKIVGAIKKKQYISYNLGDQGDKYTGMSLSRGK